MTFINFKKILIIRFSSFGDIVFTRSTLAPLKDSLPQSEIHWLVRSDLEGTLKSEERIDKLITFDRKKGLIGLIKLAFELRKEKYDLIYDAHNNVRSFFVRFILNTFSSSSSLKVVIRSKDRLKRILLFSFGINKFPNPYKAMESFWSPLKKELEIEGKLRPISWGDQPSEEEKRKLEGAIVLVPSAAWPKKTWPIEHWKKLIEILPQKKFIILGGPADTFCEDIRKIAPERVENWAGKFSLKESCTHAAHADYIITGDTGLQQVADLSGVKGISLMGPTAFGFTTMGLLKTMEVGLPCRPCSKDGSGGCSREIYQECMVLITPEKVAEQVLKDL